MIVSNTLSTSTVLFCLRQVNLTCLTRLWGLICPSLGLDAASQWLWVRCELLFALWVIQGLVSQLILWLLLLQERNYSPGTPPSPGNQQAAKSQQSHRHSHGVASHICWKIPSVLEFVRLFVSSVRFILQKLQLSARSKLLLQQAGLLLQLYTYPHPQCVMSAGLRLG